MWVSRDMKFKLARLSSLELMVIGVDSPVSPIVATRAHGCALVELAQVLHQQATCEGWSSTDWMPYLTTHHHFDARSEPTGRSVISAALLLLAKWKWRSITGGGRGGRGSEALTVSCHGLSCERPLSLPLPSFTRPGIRLLAHCARQGRGGNTPPNPSIRAPRGPFQIRRRCVVVNRSHLTAQVLNCTHARRAVKDQRWRFRLPLTCFSLQVKSGRAGRNWAVHLRCCPMTRDMFFERIPPPTFS